MAEEPFTAPADSDSPACLPASLCPASVSSPNGDKKGKVESCENHRSLGTLFPLIRRAVLWLLMRFLSTEFCPARGKCGSEE